MVEALAKFPVVDKPTLPVMSERASQRASIAETLRTSKRIDEAWKNTEHDFQRASHEIRALEEEERRVEMDHFEEMERLREQLALSDAENRRLKREAASANNRADDLEHEARTRLDMLANKQEDNDGLRRQLADIEDAQRETKREIARQLENAERELRRAELRNKDLLERVDNQGEDRATLRDEVKQLRDELEAERHKARESQVRENQARKNLQRAQDTLSIQRDSYVSAQELEARLSQLMASNQRLTALLYSTGQYDKFFSYNANSNGLTFIAPNGGTDRDDDTNVTYSSQPDLAAHPDTEWRNWVPQDAWDLAQNFQTKHLSHVREDIFLDLLLHLNAVWKKREQRKISNLKRKHVHDLQGQRRALMHSQRYEDVVAREKIGFLKNEVKKLQTPHASRLRGMEGRVVDSTLAAAETRGREAEILVVENRQLKNETMRLEQETTSLRNSLNSSARGGTFDPNETGTFSQRRDDLLFMEGASWMARKVVDLSDQMVEDVGSLTADMAQHVTLALGNNTSRASKQNAAAIKRFSGQMEHLSTTNRDKVRTLLEKVLDAVDRA